MAVGSSFTKRSLLDLDPDYKDGHLSEAKRRCLDEETGQEQAQQRVVEVVLRELDAALAHKENEALLLQERVHVCQRVLHVLRFGVTSAYYRSYISCDGSSDSGNNTEEQTHPAVLRLMGYPGTVGPKTRGIRYKSVTEETPGPEASYEVTTVNFMEEEDEDENNGEEDNNDNEEKQEEKEEPAPLKVPRYVPPILPEPPEVCAASVRMERHRVKRRLVVGNVSKWLPEDLREDAASHKWMLYLRGPKDFPDISDIVAKVRYFLHPSYRPHDIVDVIHPFYLARRGWGEFPVRVQVHFTLPGNRPIDIIHNLKLDRTHSGLQSLGGETVVDVWLNNLQSIQSTWDCSVDCKQEVEHLPQEEQSTVVVDIEHETVADEKQTLMTVTIKQEEEEEEEEEKENEEEESEEREKENEEQDEENEEIKEFQDDSKTVKNENDEVQSYAGNSICIPIKVNLYDKLPEWPAGKLEHDLEAIKVKKENDEVQSYAGNCSCIPVEESNKSYVDSSVNGFVLHTLPDHDYLGSNTFRLKCKLCVEQCNPDNFRENALLNAQTVHVRSGHTEHSWSTSVLSPLVRTKKSQEQSQTFLQRIVTSSEYRETLLKKEEIDDATEQNSEFCSAVSVPNNGIVSNTSLVQCVDAEGNLLYISLQNPNFAAKCDLPKDVLVNSSEAILKYPVGDMEDNPISDPAVDGAKTIVNKIDLMDKAVTSASVRPGQSLLKKNCLELLPSASLETNNSSSSSEFVAHKLVLKKLHPRPVKLEPKESEIQLKEAAHVVSRIADTCQAVTWLLRQIPLVDERVSKDPEYKQQHPYCAPSIGAFLAWPVGKRHCAERLRARTAHSILQESDSSRFSKWSVRHIMKWSRLHALTPFLAELSSKQTEAKSTSAVCSSLRHTVSEPSEVQDWLESVAEASKTAEEMEVVNVEELIPSSLDSKMSACSEETSNCVTRVHSDPVFCGFLRDTAEQLDIRLSPEILFPGVSYPAVEELLYRACQSLCEDLLRRSLCRAWGHWKKMPNEIVLADVQDALLTRSDFDVFTNAGLGVQAYDATKWS